ncbi:MAG: histidine kinase dimerization/phosphoacceptor domain -containing protein [Bosea sp. (in: a-proteobacteria)]
MINLSRFQTVQGRLLALMAFIIIPIATLSIILATTTYRSVNKSIDEAQIQTVSSFAVRARVWFRGALRALVTTVESVKTVPGDVENCSVMTKRILDGINGFQAMRIHLPGGKTCYASKTESITSEALDRLAAEQLAMKLEPAWGGPRTADSRYGAVSIGKSQHLVIYTRNTRPDEGDWDAILLIDPVLADQTFELGLADGSSYVALMKRGQQVLAARGVAESESSWLPDTENVAAQPRRWQSKEPGTRSYVYATQLVAEPDLYVLARFDNKAADAAFYQFLVLCITPLLTLALLCITYARAIQFDVVLWLKGIETAARARHTTRDTLAPVGDSMPSDIRHVAEAFNTMVLEGNKREDALRQTLDANQYLLRELNHRVKNSLQVIQSYLALSRRQRSGMQKIHFAETEAMVQVMSTSYRLALIDGTMRPVVIRPFLEEIIDNLSSSLKRSDQWIDVQIDVEAGLVVDRIIPLGLSVVEAVIAGLRADRATLVRVLLASQADGLINIVVSTDGIRSQNLPPPRIIAGLAAQLEASVAKGEPGQILNWTFSA